VRGLFSPPRKILADEHRTVTGRNAQRGVLDNHKPEEANTMTNITFNTISVECGNSNQEFCLYWQEEDGNHLEFICAVYGFENAIRVANGIAHEQVEFVKHPSFDPYP
jgi:hypothetical protein